jgi:hypothetical protein
VACNDPFAIPEPGFEPFDGRLPDSDLSQPDDPPSTLKEFLRRVIKSVPPSPSPPPERGGRVIGHIKGYPG